ncbi:hypothetical protein [Leptospira noguchii]|uniref:hypothetical protein n=1 Tax=Leptospira noguchii TaxID=28182 RepID=UPI001FB7A37B|nr:hypothetical protein [Leptospira noguchii]UOG48408.1 hypothetical protein MAL00_15690 [Leptospira noguchii]
MNAENVILHIILVSIYLPRIDPFRVIRLIIVDLNMSNDLKRFRKKRFAEFNFDSKILFNCGVGYDN